MSKITVQIEVVDYDDKFYRMVGYYPSFVSKEDCKIVSPVAPVQRKSLGSYQGVEIFEGDTVYFIDLETLEIESEKIREIGNWLNKDDSDISKMYLSPKEANQRLKEEVKKVAKERKFTLKELEDYDNDWFMMKNPLSHAIELVEKEFNVKYLEE